MILSQMGNIQFVSVLKNLLVDVVVKVIYWLVWLDFLVNLLIEIIKMKCIFILFIKRYRNEYGYISACYLACSMICEAQMIAYKEFDCSTLADDIINSIYKVYKA